MRPVPLLDRPVRQEVSGDHAAAPGDLPRPGRDHPPYAVDLDHDLVQARQSEQQRVVDVRQQPLDERPRLLVAQGQLHRRGVAVGDLTGPRKRQPKSRDVTATTRQLLGEGRHCGYR